MDKPVNGVLKQYPYCNDLYIIKSVNASELCTFVACKEVRKMLNLDEGKVVGAQFPSLSGQPPSQETSCSKYIYFSSNKYFQEN